jgi:KDO2-lipid IV(A) lauroyltransferase
VTSFFLKLFFRVASWLPDWLAIGLGCALGWFFDRVLRWRRRRITAHLALAFPELDAAALARRRTAVYRHFGLLALELVRLPGMTAAQLLARTEIRGGEHLEAAQARGKGVLILGAHEGCWELGLAGASRRGYPVHVILKEVRGRVGQQAIDFIRGAHGVCGVSRRGSVFQLLRLLKRKALIGFVLDQNMTADEGIFVDFFGRAACTMPGLAVLAQRTGTPVVPISFHRDATLRRQVLTLFPEVPWEAPPGLDQDALLRHNTQRYTRILEDQIRAHPEQWIWMHNRWKTRPPA